MSRCRPSLRMAALVQPTIGARFAGGCSLMILSLALLGCAGNRPAAEAPKPAAPADAPSTGPGAEALAAIDQFERRQRERAELATRQGRLADALQGWDVLATLRPQRAEYRAAHADVQKQIQAQIAERLPKAQAAHKRGELDSAAQQYMAVLALNPEHELAADGLRAVERDRNKRNYVGKLARNTLVRRQPGDADNPKSNGKAAASKPAPKATGDRNEVEHAAMLAAQGELDDAIALLQAHLAVQRNDAEARRLLADLQAQKAERSQQGGRDAPAPPAAVKPSRSAP